MFAVLFDKNFKALGTKTTYYCSSWSLTRRNFEMDSLTATTEKIDQSAKAVYIGMFNDVGRLSYLSFSGRPKNKKGLTTITAMDLRRIFIQNCMISYASYQTSPTVKAWVTYLLGIPGSLCASYGVIDYTIDTSEFDQQTVAWVDGSIPSANAIGDLWEELQAAMMRYNFTVVPECNITTDSSTGKTTGSIKFVVKMITKTYSIKLSDFDEARVMNDSTEVNRAIAYNKTTGAEIGEWWLCSSPSTGKETIVPLASAAYLVKSGSLLTRVPARYKTFSDEDPDKAKSEALNELEKNRYKGSVQISLDAPLAKELKNADIWCQAYIYGYNSADDNTQKLLPMMWRSEDQSGQVKACFGRLDDYYYI